MLKELNVECVELYCTPNGQFPHNPEPLKEHLTDISELVIKENADFGIVVDPDVDRLALVCEDGSMFGEEYTLVACADYVLGKLNIWPDPVRDSMMLQSQLNQLMRDVDAGNN